MITEEEYKKAQKIVNEYRNQQLNIPLVRLSLTELRQMYNKTNGGDLETPEVQFTNIV